MTSKLTIFYLHQVNFSDERPADLIIRELITLLLAEKDHRFIFLPAEKAIEAYLKQ